APVRRFLNSRGFFGVEVLEFERFIMFCCFMCGAAAIISSSASQIAMADSQMALKSSQLNSFGLLVSCSWRLVLQDGMLCLTSWITLNVDAYGPTSDPMLYAVSVASLNCVMKSLVSPNWFLFISKGLRIATLSGTEPWPRTILWMALKASSAYSVL
ncbi:hypothetical protein BDW69DRAFT_166634, partial [Aspergillus filifer]